MQEEESLLEKADWHTGGELGDWDAYDWQIRLSVSLHCFLNTGSLHKGVPATKNTT
jgi:hypothetical protein